MHKIHAKEFTLDDFSCEHLMDDELELMKYIIARLNENRLGYLELSKIDKTAFEKAPKARNINSESLDKAIKRLWWQMIQLLPSSYNQKRTVMLNYEVLANIYKSRKNHKLDEWSGKDCFKDLYRNCNTCVKRNTSECHGGKEDGFIQWIESLPYSELITGEDKE